MSLLPFGSAPTKVTQTLGSKLRDLVNTAPLKDPWLKPFMKTPPMWQPSTAYLVGNATVNGGNIYIMIAATGTSAASGGPTGVISGAGITDNTCTWTYFGKNTVTQDPTTTFIPWSASLSVTAGQYITTTQYLYGVVASGTTGSTAPTGTSNAVTDNTATLTYMGVIEANPYTQDFPTVTQTTSSPAATYTNIYNPIAWGGVQSAQNALPYALGTGYAVNDTITLTGGTNTVATVLKVTQINGSGGVMAVSITTPGSYTVPPAYPVAQGSTSGSGTSATFYVSYGDPPWLNILGGHTFVSSSVGYASINTFQAYPGNFPINNSAGLEFMTDAPTIYFTNGNSWMGGIFINDILYSIDPGTITSPSAQYTIIDFSGTGGSKIRKIRVEWNTVHSVSFGKIGVGTNYQIWRPQQSNKITAAFISDSIFAGSTYHAFVNGNCTAARISRALGWSNPVALVQGGTGYINQGAGPGSNSNNFISRIPQGLAYNPDVWVIAGSVNDRQSNFPSITPASTTIVQVPLVHGLTTGQTILWSGVTGTGASLLNGIPLVVTVTSASAFTIPVNSVGLTFTSGGSFINYATGNPPIVDYALALYRAIRAGSKAPIVVVGLISANQVGLSEVETLLQSAIAIFNDPNTFFVPVEQDPWIPHITGSYNNNPAPSGNTQSTSSNVGLYINTVDNIHPFDFGVNYLAYRWSNSIAQDAIANMV